MTEYPNGAPTDDQWVEDASTPTLKNRFYKEELYGKEPVEGYPRQVQDMSLPAVEREYFKRGVLGTLFGGLEGKFTQFLSRYLSLVSVKSFGAVGNGIANDSLAFQKALQASLSTNQAVFVPKGVFKVDPDVIKVAEKQALIGAGSNYTTIISSSATLDGSGVEVLSGGEVSGIYVRGFKEGITNKGYWTKIFDNKLSYNLIGLHFKELSYIVKAFNNDITFNSGAGVLVGNEVYELDIHHNIIDNNKGIGVGLYGTSLGCIISNNTIEGNRDYSTGNGCGLLIKGVNLSRLIISDNWFEANGSSQTSSDLFMLGPTSADYYSVGEEIKLLLPAEYRNLFSGITGTGATSIERNSFTFTKYGAVISGSSRTTINLRGNSFKGVLGRNNKHICLNFGSASLDSTVALNIEGNNYNNTDDMAINAEVETGVGGSIVHSSLSRDNLKKVRYNGEPLFHKRFTLRELSKEFTIVKGEPWVVSGGGVKNLKYVLGKQYEGHVVPEEGSSILYGVTSDSTEFLPHTSKKILFLAEPGSAIRFESSPGIWKNYILSNDDGKVTLSSMPETLVTGKGYITPGSIVYGYIVIPPNKEYLFKDIYSVEITTWDSN